MKNKYLDLVLKEKENIIKNLGMLVEIPSVLDEKEVDKEKYPYGKYPKMALDKMKEIADNANFKTSVIKNQVLEITYGNCDKFILLASHLDVVPAGVNWETDPFKMILKEGKLIGRGTLDDKGGAISAFYALKIIKDNNIKLKKGVKLIFGTDEENQSRCVKTYLKEVDERPVYGFVPDADFPLIFAEKGIARFLLEFENDLNIKGIACGDAYNMVCSDCKIKLDKDEYHFEGKSAHGSTPELGDNAISKLYLFLKEKKHQDSILFKVLDNFILEDKTDYLGKKLKLDKYDNEMKNLTLNLGFLKLVDNKIQLGIDVRYPKNINFEIIKDVISKIENTILLEFKNSNPLYVSPKSKLVKTLMKTYINQTGEKTAKPVSIGGGTYAREFENMVAFGPHFEKSESLIHAPGEYISVDDLLLATSIYLEAIIRLCK